MRRSVHITVFTAVILISSLMAREASAGRIYWCFYDQISYALIIFEPGEVLLIPVKDGGYVSIPCRYSLCWMILQDKKVGQIGNMTFWQWTHLLDDVTTGEGPMDGFFAAQTSPVTGDIQNTSATFDVFTGGFDELSPQTSVTATFQGSPTGFNASVGAPGDQLPQGGTVSFTTQWSSDDPIGVDPATGQELVLGDFTLEVSAPLTEFTASPQFLRFTGKEVYTLSSGQQIEGVVTTQGPMSFIDVP